MCGRSRVAVARRVARDTASALLVTVGLIIAAELAMRCWSRFRTGQWPSTLASRLHDSHFNATRLYRGHPFLHTAPREGMRASVLGKIVTFNSLGYRSPERSPAKPPGMRRVVCAGGSTTFDLLASRDEETWPWRLEDALRDGPAPVEVWNAGFPGWTSLENLISLALREVDLRPDVVLLFQGINDLQAAAHIPFDPQYTFHASMSATVLGLDLPPLPLYERSVLLERLRAVVGRPLTPAPERHASDGPHDQITQEGIAVFERNVRSFVAIARAHGAQVVLVTQPVRIRAAHANAARAILAWWIPDLAPQVVATELERLNDVLRTVAGATSVPLLDVARDERWDDGDFGDALHYTAAGSEKLAAMLTPRLRSLLGSTGTP